MFYHLNPESGFLDTEESRHCAKVLRKLVGDTIRLFDGKGNVFDCELTEVGKRCAYTIKNKQTHSQPKVKIRMAIAPPKKASRLDFMIEKLVELGADQILLTSTQNSERNRLNLNRIEKQVISACKQSRQYYLPEVKEIKLADLINSDAELLICHCYEDMPRKILNEISESNNNQIWLIGPEGDFSRNELASFTNRGATFIDLGEQRLRTETAAIYLMSSLKNIRG